MEMRTSSLIYSQSIVVAKEKQVVEQPHPVYGGIARVRVVDLSR